MPYAIRIFLLYIFFLLKFYVLPPVQGVWKMVKTHYIPRMIIIVWGCLIAQTKRIDALVTTQKPPTLLNVPLLRKSGNTIKNRNFWNNGNFLDFSRLFQQWYIAKSLCFLRCFQCIQTLHLSYQTPFYNDLNLTIFYNFSDPWYQG